MTTWHCDVPVRPDREAEEILRVLKELAIKFIVLAMANSLPEDPRSFKTVRANDPSFNDVKEEPKLPVELAPELLRSMKDQLNSNVSELDKAYFTEEGSVADQTVYSGVSGIVLLHYHLATTLYKDDPVQRLKHLQQAGTYLGTVLRDLNEERFTFLCGAGGPLALGVLVYHELRDRVKYHRCIVKMKEIHNDIKPFSQHPCELLYGLAGWLYALLLVNKSIPGTFDDAMITQLVMAILKAGKAYQTSECPMMFRYQKTYYLGAAHGLAGILFVLLQVPIESLRPRIRGLVKPCVDFLLRHSLPSGNIPSSMERRKRDLLVQWCHGAPGAVYIFSLAHQVYGDQAYKDAAIECGEVVWMRGLLKKGYSLCHGVAGNAYTFIQLYKLTGCTFYQRRAVKFAEWCTTYRQRECDTPSTPFSLFEGVAGPTLFYCDMMCQLGSAKFPAFEL